MKFKQTLSIIIWAYRRKFGDNKATLYARVTVNGKRAKISLGRRIDTSLWDEKNSLMKEESSEEVIEFLDIVRGELRQCYYELRSTGKEITVEAIKNKYLSIEEDKKTLVEVFELHNYEMKTFIGKGISEGTYQRYVITLGKAS